jgi:hypothetical protein
LQDSFKKQKIAKWSCQSMRENQEYGIQTFISSAIILLFVFCIPRLTAIFTTKLFSQSLTIAAAKP